MEEWGQTCSRFARYLSALCGAPTSCRVGMPSKGVRAIFNYLDRLALVIFLFHRNIPAR